jgi:hypothetical protein
LREALYLVERVSSLSSKEVGEVLEQRCRIVVQRRTQTVEGSKSDVESDQTKMPRPLTIEEFATRKVESFDVGVKKWM